MFRIKVLICTCFLSFSSGAAIPSAGKKLLIDQDGGADDAMAIFMALLYEKHFDGPVVVGLTTSHGNVNESQAFENTQRILDICNRSDVLIYRGTPSSLVISVASDHYFGFDGLGDLDNVTYSSIPAQPLQASLAMIEMSKKYEGDLVIASLGALTNVALAIKIDPEFIGRLSQLYVAAGNIYDSVKYPAAEFNALMDVEAYHMVAANANPDKVTLIPFSPILDSHNITREWRQNVLGAIPTVIMQAQNEFERKSLVKSDTWTLLDPVAMGIILEADLIDEMRLSDNSIYLCGDQRGINTNNMTETAKPNVKIMYKPNDGAYQKLLMSIFSGDQQS